MERAPAPGVDVRINAEGYTVSHWGASVSVVSEDVGGARWRNHVHGVTRETDFGSETIVVDGARTEKFLTVTERQGEKTWRWKLATRLVPRLGDDGAVSFLDKTNNHVTSLVIDPVQILDRSGKEITPEGLQWNLEKSDSGWWLTLDLDDRDLPLPYVIDPAGHVPVRPAGQRRRPADLAHDQRPGRGPANDLLVAHIARSRQRGLHGTGRLDAGRRTRPTATSSARPPTTASPASPSPPRTSGRWTSTQPAAGGMRRTTASRARAPLDVVGHHQHGEHRRPSPLRPSRRRRTARSSSPSSRATATRPSTAAGMTERHDAATTGMSNATDDMSQVTAGATGDKTSTASLGPRRRPSGRLQRRRRCPVGRADRPGTPLAGTVSLGGTASDADSAIAQVQFQRSPAGAGYVDEHRLGGHHRPLTPSPSTLRR